MAITVEIYEEIRQCREKYGYGQLKNGKAAENITEYREKILGRINGTMGTKIKKRTEKRHSDLQIPEIHRRMSGRGQASAEKTAAYSAPDLHPAVRGKRLYGL